MFTIIVRFCLAQERGNAHFVLWNACYVCNSLTILFHSNEKHFDPARKEQGDRLLKLTNRTVAITIFREEHKTIIIIITTINSVSGPMRGKDLISLFVIIEDNPLPRVSRNCCSIDVSGFFA